MQTQANNGWRSYTTLYDYHFDADTQELNQAGRLKLRWISLHVPQQYRLAYVAEGLTTQDSEIRLANVQTAADSISGTDSSPPVILRAAQALGTPAQEVDLLRRSYLGSIPEPRLPYAVKEPATN